MKHLYEPAAVDEVKTRLARLQPDSERLWGRMSPAQALAHCAASFEMALGEINPPRMLLGRLLGRVAKRSLVDRGEPMRRDAPTARRLLVAGDRDFAAERRRLLATIDRFVTSGPAGCTRHPHLFMGPMTPVEWATLMYQHLDHHFRQFRVWVGRRKRGCAGPASIRVVARGAAARGEHLGERRGGAARLRVLRVGHAARRETRRPATCSGSAVR